MKFCPCSGLRDRDDLTEDVLDMVHQPSMLTECCLCLKAAHQSPFFPGKMGKAVSNCCSILSLLILESGSLPHDISFPVDEK